MIGKIQKFILINFEGCRNRTPTCSIPLETNYEFDIKL